MICSCTRPQALCLALNCAEKTSTHTKEAKWEIAFRHQHRRSSLPQRSTQRRSKRPLSSASRRWCMSPFDTSRVLRTADGMNTPFRRDIQTGSFPSTICYGPGGIGCSVLMITYHISCRYYSQSFAMSRELIPTLATSTTLVPTTATSTIISQVPNIFPQKTFFAPCTTTGAGTPSSDVSTITRPNGVLSMSVMSTSSSTSPSTSSSDQVPSGYTQDNNSESSATNHPALIGSVVAAVVTLSLSIIGFFIWNLWKKNRAMKEGKEDKVKLTPFLPTPYPVSIPSSPYSATHRFP